MRSARTLGTVAPRGRRSTRDPCGRTGRGRWHRRWDDPAARGSPPASDARL